MKLSKNQKAFLKTIKNDKARAEQKTQFKLQNKFDRKGVEIIFTDGQFKTDDPRVIEFLNSTPMFCSKVDVATQITQEEFDKKLDELNWIKINNAKCAVRIEPINWAKRWKEKCSEMDKIIDESELKENTKEESKSDFDKMQWGDRKEPETLTKEALRDLTEPKVEITRNDYMTFVEMSKLDDLTLREVNNCIADLSFDNRISKEEKEELHLIFKRKKEILIEPERQEILRKSKTIDAPKEFCVEITKENKEVLSKVWGGFFNTIQNCTVGNFLHTNSLFRYCTQSNTKYPIRNYTRLVFDYTRLVFAKVVSTEEFLTYIGREDLIECKRIKISDLPQTILPKNNDYFLGTNFQDDIEFYKKALELSLKAYKDVVLKRDSVIAERNGVIQVPSDLAQTPLTPDECIKPTETVELKAYTKGDMKKCFWNSRNLLNDVRETIWEYPNFEQYLKSSK